VQLPVMPPVEPMLATSVPEIPTRAGMRYEPKWDGFRTIIFRDGDEVELASRGGKTMTRYFPEVVEQVRAQFPARCVIDGEIVVVRRELDAQPRLDFEVLQQRIHPAASRVKLLAGQTPADFIAFDLLALDDRSLMAEPYETRRAALETALASAVPRERPRRPPVDGLDRGRRRPPGTGRRERGRGRPPHPRRRQPVDG